MHTHIHKLTHTKIVYNHLFTYFYCFKHSYLILIIFKQIYLTHGWNLNRYYLWVRMVLEIMATK